MKRIFIITLMCVLFAGAALAAQATVKQEGSFSRTIRDQINANFDELYGAVKGGLTGLVTTTITASGDVTLDDGVTASPSLTLTDATDETAVFSKVDGSHLTMTITAADALQILTGNLLIGNGTPGETINGEDLYVEGISEFDGAANFDGTADFDSTSNFDGATTHTADLSGDGGDQFWGFLQDQVASTTVAITAAQAAKTFVSNSADVMTLPEASTVLGARYTFVCGTADDFDINPADGTDVIGTVASITGTNTTTVLAPSAGDAIRCTDTGSSIILEAVAADLWVSIGTANGIWTDVN